MKTCKKCGDSDFYSSGKCKSCRASYEQRRWQLPEVRERSRLYAQTWRKTNRVRLRDYAKQWRTNNPDKVASHRKKLLDTRHAELLAYWKAYYQRNKTKWKEWRANNPDKKKLADKTYAASHQALRRKTMLAWSRQNAVKVRIYHHNRKSLKKLNGGTLSKDIAVALLGLQRNRCACCRVSLANGYHLDHIIALAKGGPNIDGNVQLLCPSCNASKRDRDPIIFMQSRGFLL